MKTFRLFVLGLFVVAGALFLAGQNQAFAEEMDKEGAKGNPWILHSYAPGDTSVLHNPVSSHWTQIFLNLISDTTAITCFNSYHCYGWRDTDNDGIVDYCDTLRMKWDDIGGVPRPETTCYWMHVSKVTLTLFLTDTCGQIDLLLKRVSAPQDTMRVRFTGGANLDSLARAYRTPVCTWWHGVRSDTNYYHIDSIATGGVLRASKNIRLQRRGGGPADTTIWHVERVGFMFVEFTGGASHDSLDRAINHPVSTWWQEVLPFYGPYFHIDQITPGDTLQPCRNIRFGTQWWQVEKWSIDIITDSNEPAIHCPPIPTLTQWGIIVLAGLLLASGVFIMLRRRKAVPA